MGLKKLKITHGLKMLIGNFYMNKNMNQCLNLKSMKI